MLPDIRVPNREELMYLLSEAMEVEHGLLCCYLFAAFSLKRHATEGLDEGEVQTVDRWRETLFGLAADEMLNLALLGNLCTAVGGQPRLERPAFPVQSGHHASGIVLALTRFDRGFVDRLVTLRKGPRGPSREAERPSMPVGSPRGRLMPGAEAYSTLDGLYRALRAGLQILVGQMGELTLFCGDPETQVGPTLFPNMALVAVTDLASALRALHQIADRATVAEDSHLERLQAMADEYDRLVARRRDFVPARPVGRNPVHEPLATRADVLHVSSPQASRLLDLGNTAYNLALRYVWRAFSQHDDSPAARRVLLEAAREVMKVIAPIGEALTQLPANTAYPGVNAGMNFALSRTTGYLPQQRAAWELLVERTRELATDCVQEPATPQVDLPKLGDRLHRIADYVSQHAPHRVAEQFGAWSELPTQPPPDDTSFQT